MAGFWNQGRIPGQIINPPAGRVRFVCQLKGSAACDRRGKSQSLAGSLVNQFSDTAFNRNEIPELIRIADIRGCQGHCTSVCGSQSLASVYSSNMEAVFRAGQLPAVNGFISVIPPQHYAVVLLQMILCAVFVVIENLESICFIVVGVSSGFRGNKHIIIVVRNSGRIPGIAQIVLRQNPAEESIGFRVIF